MCHDVEYLMLLHAVMRNLQDAAGSGAVDPKKSVFTQRF